jgi:hypothetical protein
MPQVPLAPPPQTGQPIDGWLFLLWKRLTATGQLLWSGLSFTGSNLTDIETRNHADLQNLNTASYTHLTATNHTDLTDAGDSTLHYHAADRARANHSGTQLLATISDAGTIASQAANSVAITGGSISGTTLTMIGYTVATLPAAGTVGRIAYVTDALAPAFLTIIVGGGAINSPVFDNGTNWVAF